MTQRTSLLLAALFIITMAAQAQTRQLFNGKTLAGWHADVPEKDKKPKTRSPFVVRNGMLVSLGTPGGHLITDSVYSNYTLEVQYRFTGKPGNCGVLVHASKPRVLYDMFPQSIEVQMMHENAGDFWCIGEDITVPDMELRRGPRQNWGAVDGKERRILNLTDGSEKPLGQWNTMIITCSGQTIKVWVNGQLVNEGYNCTADHGQVALQAEGSEVEFRTVALTPLARTAKTNARLNHTAIYVRNVPISGDFYRNIIGLDTIPEPFHDGQHIWLRTGPGMALHIIGGATEKKEYYKNQHTCFSVSSVDDFVTRLRNNGIMWEDRDGAKNAITTRVDGVKQLWLQDPDGYWIEINDARE